MPANSEHVLRDARHSSIQSLLRGLEVLFGVVESDGPVSLAAVTKMTGLNRATAYRMLTTLVEGGYLSFGTDEPVYSPGAQILRYLSGTHLQTALRHRVMPLLTRLGEQSQETVTLLMPAWPDLVCIEVILSPHPVRRHRSVGDLSDMTNGATGRAYLAFLPDEDIDEVLQLRPLRPLASGAQYSREKLDQSIEELRQRKFTISESETVEGMNGLATPLFDQVSDRPIAIISISGPAQRWDSAAMNAFAPTLLAEISDFGFGAIESPATPILEKESS
ncbi:MAG: hypothetical protein QOD50_993 [Actinomycetota bacterium]|nr:hypothetical protein [Actinomycetota bacterium]